jgi:hypothetical protein
MTKLFNLDFHGERFTVPKLSLCHLFERQRGPFDATSYNVQSSVSVEIFKVFVNALKTGTNVPVPRENSGHISLLATEFWLEDLAAECSALQLDSASQLITALSERITQVEHQLSSQVPTIVPELKESITNYERQLESLLPVIEAKPATLRTEITDLRQFAQSLQTELEAMNSKCEKQSEALVARIASVEGKISDSLQSITSRLAVCERSIVAYETQKNEVRASIEELRTHIASVGGIEMRRRHRHSTTNSGADPNPETPAPPPIPDSVRPVSPSPTPIQPVRIFTPAPVPVPPVSPSDSLKEVEFPLKEAKSLDGIISYLTRKHGGNVHDKEVVTITSKSVYSDLGYALRNIADLTSDSCFFSTNEPGQWVCWDFHEMRVRPTHYTIQAVWLKSWMVESSLDGEWTTENDDFKTRSWQMASFAISNSAECRFIRPTQTGK